jgi:integrase
MAARAARIPKYRLYKPKNLAVVRIEGHDVYLGKYDSPESHEKYHRVIAEWLSGSGPRCFQSRTASRRPEEVGLTINDLILRFWKHGEIYYRHADGSPTRELDNFRDALRPLRRLYGGTPARDFGPKALKAVRETMINSGLCRRTINRRIGRIVYTFKWALENELVPAGIYQALKSVQGLRRGRSAAREKPPIRPVPATSIDAIRPFVARQVWAMVQLQRLTGARPSEVMTMRTCDLDTSSAVWTYAPADHKSAHHDQARTICIGPRAQTVLRPWLRTNLTEYLFSPREAREEHWAERRRNRKSQMTPSQALRRRKRHPRRAPRDHYDTASYRRAIHYGCKKAGIATWHPHQLRHSVATQLRQEFGLEAARVILGHTSPVVTEIYAEVDRQKAKEVMQQVG